MSAAPPTLVRYRGMSMWPCFQDGDLLEVVPAKPEQVGIGDCVVLKAADGTLIAHRVVGRHPGLRTRGDALRRDDDGGPAAPRLTGRIVARHRLGRRSVVTGGWPGWLAGRFFYFAGRIDPQRPGRGGRLGRMVRGVCAPLAGPVIRRLISGPETQEVDTSLQRLGPHVVAHRDHPGAAWQIRWPWRLFIARPETLRKG